MDMCPAPLSGEWAGESIGEMIDRFGLGDNRFGHEDELDESKADDFEEGFSDGFWEEVLESAKYSAR